MSESIYKLFTKILIVFFSIWCSFVPMNPKNVAFEVEPVTTESEYICIHCENLTGRMISAPYATKLMKLVNGEWETTCTIPVSEGEETLKRGQSAVVCKNKISVITGSETLEAGKYKMIFSYKVVDFSLDNGEEAIKMKAEVLFDVVEPLN